MIGLLHAEAPVVVELYPRLRHGRQVEEEIAFKIFEYLPTAQGMQADDAEEDEYVPAGQDVHVEFDKAPVAAENLPTGHDPHTELDTLYEPAAQGEAPRMQAHQVQSPLIILFV